MRSRMMVPIGCRASGRVIAAQLVTVVLAVLAVGGATPAAAQPTPPLPTPNVMYPAHQGARLTGPIVARQGDDMIVRDETTKKLSLVTLKRDTRITQPTGFLKMERKRRDDSTLIPGLVIVIKGYGGTRGNLMADAISFHKSSLRTASQISAGEVQLKAAERQTARVAAANRDSLRAVTSRARDSMEAITARARDSIDAISARVANLDMYDLKFTTTVNFETGSAMLSDQAKRALDNAVMQGQGLQGYIVEVAGFADATGPAEVNQRLSLQRADAVIAYLTEAHSVPARRFANPTGMGTSHPAASNDTQQGRAQNRRAEVRVLVNRGLRPPTNH